VVTIAGITFDRWRYDEPDDVLHAGNVPANAHAARTPEGHVVHLDGDGRIVGVTLCDVRRTLERERELRISLNGVRVVHEDLAAALSPERDEERLRKLRGAVYRGDGEAVVELLGAEGPIDALQLAGDGALVAIAEGMEAASKMARRCVDDLHARNWEGDKLLAAELESALGAAPSSGLRPLPVDLDELGDTLEGDPERGGGRLDLRSGDVWPEPVYGDPWDEEDADDEDRWLYFVSEGSSAGYADMEDFIATVRDERLARTLETAIRGRGAFRRFRDVLDETAVECGRWMTFSDERRRGRARQWLAEHRLRPVPASGVAPPDGDPHGEQGAV
jgi:hypothetical protein